MNEETARVRLENFAFFLKKTTNILHSNYFYNHLILKTCIPRHRIVISPPVLLKVSDFTQWNWECQVSPDVTIPWVQDWNRSEANALKPTPGKKWKRKCFVNKTKPLCKINPKNQKNQEFRDLTVKSEILIIYVLHSRTTLYLRPIKAH